MFEEPVAVTKDNIKDYLGEPDFPKKEEICAGKLAAECDEARALAARDQCGMTPGAAGPGGDPRRRRELKS